MKKLPVLLIVLLLGISACTLDQVDTGSPITPNTGGNISGDSARVTRIIDGDTIDVELNGQTFRVRYIGVNTPERDEPCYSDATAANSAMVSGQTVTLVRDVSETDRYDRLLRYIYVGDTFVNESLVAQGYAEAVLYEPDDREFEHFAQLERQAAQQNLGCHPTGIFNDGSTTR